MKKTVVILCTLAALCLRAQAQEVSLENLNVSGYVQVQNQWGEGYATLKVGAANENPGEAFNRFGVRRGRLKFAYGTGLSSAVFQLDITEKGIGVKDAYLDIKDPWIGTMGLRAGVFVRPFGYEAGGYSTALRESPERSSVFEVIFPDEQDMGAMLTLQAPGASPWNIFKLEAGLFSGNGVRPENDSKRDFIGHLSATRDWKRFGFSAGVSYYNGEMLVAAENGYGIREYLDFDARIALRSPLGLTKLHGEYLVGRHPGVGDFDGGYAMLVQYLGRTSLALVGKYDWFYSKTTVGRETLGVGALIDFDPGMRLTAYYEFHDNEDTDHLPDRLEDNVFTLRLQYKF